MAARKMRIDGRGVALLKHWEGCRLEAYQDVGGVWTIGVGHTGPDVTPTMRITEEQAEMLLREDVREAEDVVNRGITVPMTQAQFSSFVSLAFNIGGRHFAASTVRRQFNAGNPYAAIGAMFMWRKVDGQDVPGLARRRVAEMQMALEDGLAKGD